MARTIWKGALNFGLVNVPVGIYPATQDKMLHFNQFEKGTSDRIRYKKVNERTGREVEADDIVKGFDLGGGEYVMLTDDDLIGAEPKRSRLIEITDFVSLDDIDPIYFRATYYVAPEGEAANKAYGLLRQVMRDAGRVGIGTLVMRNKEYPVAIRPDEKVLKLETMYFPDEVRPLTSELPDLPGTVELTKRELSMAHILLESMESEWDPNRYRDTHREKVEALVEKKRKGDQIIEHASDDSDSMKVVDLMEALEASIKSSSGSGTTRPTRARKSPAKRATPVKRTRKTAKTADRKAS